ncbi:MAG: D-alanyl-D-alanine carboxypeptidase/D-alanyl-D-alanine-endopeptidase [Ignavibacteria bacterium]|nr:D-alanyl-D-alanine carboxypeptidase/D-alanyl-D-alanine-endopeptidase [Ignavibacteria bacterium]
MYFFNLLLLIFFPIINDNSIEFQVKELLKKSLPKNSEYSLTCFSTSKNDYIIKVNSEVPLIPASTNKLFTTGVALLSLGPNFSINTELYCDDNDLSDRIINGNLFLKGYGDPTITTENLKNLITKLKLANIQSVTGNIIIDDSFFEETFYRNEWIEDENISVPLPPISSVTVNSNSIFLRVNGSNKIGRSGNVTLLDELDYFEIINKTKTTNTRTRLSALSKFENNKEIITITGNIRKNSSIVLKVHIKRPDYYVGNLLAKLLRENGISFWGEIKKGKVPKFSDRISTISTPLTEFLKPINKNSNNFFAEHLFLIIGANYAGGQGSPFDASQAINTYLKSLNIYEPNFSMVDGSGISRQNQFSTNTLVKLLHQIYLNPAVFNDFYNSLSIPQTDGTLHNRFSNLFPPDRLRGKTGTLNGVTSLAGYVVSKSGDLLIFAINFNFRKGNQSKMRELQDKIITLIADSY